MSKRLTFVKFDQLQMKPSIDAKPQVGVDINLIGSNQWMAATLPFVCGLGPRKARALLQV